QAAWPIIHDQNPRLLPNQKQQTAAEFCPPASRGQTPRYPYWFLRNRAAESGFGKTARGMRRGQTARLGASDANSAPSRRPPVAGDIVNDREGPWVLAFR